MNPCKDEKCISYPICISKSEIDCPELFEYFMGCLEIANETTHSYPITWNTLKQFLPHIDIIHVPNADVECTEKGLLV